LPEIIAGGIEIPKREPLLSEIESFLDSVRSKTPPLVSGAEGRRALALAIEVLIKIREHSVRAGIELNFS
jgi:predicted dehydrogenase